MVIAQWNVAVVKSPQLLWSGLAPWGPMLCDSVGPLDHGLVQWRRGSHSDCVSELGALPGLKHMLS